MKLDIPGKIWNYILSMEHYNEDDLRYAPYSRWGNYIMILSVVYNETDPNEYYNTVDFFRGDLQQWEKIVTGIENACSEFFIPEINVTLKELYIDSPNITEILKEYTKNGLTHKMNIEREFYYLASTLKKTKELFRNYGNNTSFMRWYHRELGLSKDKVSLLLKRLNLVECFPKQNKIIAHIPENGIKALTNKKITMDIKEKVITAIEKGEIKTEKEIKIYIDNLKPKETLKPTIFLDNEKGNAIVGRYFDNIKKLNDNDNKLIIKHLEAIDKIVKKNNNQKFSLETF